jgi:hypothetical protein
VDLTLSEKDVLLWMTKRKPKRGFISKGHLATVVLAVSSCPPLTKISFQFSRCQYLPKIPAVFAGERRGDNGPYKRQKI